MLHKRFPIASLGFQKQPSSYKIVHNPYSECIFGNTLVRPLLPENRQTSARPTGRRNRKPDSPSSPPYKYPATPPPRNNERPPASLRFPVTSRRFPISSRRFLVRAMGRRIVVAVDQGEESLHALQWCLNNVIAYAAEGENPNDTLVLLHASAHPPVYPATDGIGYMSSSDMTAAMDRYGKAVAEQVMETAKRICATCPRVKVETVVESGDPRDVICDVVEKLGPDLLVMGTHGYGLIKRAFLGSVSNHCAQNVKCPVLIVKRPAH